MVYGAESVYSGDIAEGEIQREMDELIIMFTALQPSFCIYSYLFSLRASSAS